MAFTLSQPLYSTAGSYTAQQDRLLMHALASSEGVRLIPTATTGDLAVTTTGTTNASVTVAAGEVIVFSAAGQGAYFGYNDAATVTGPFAANAVANPRIDVVVVRITDTGGTPVVAFQILTGTPAASPSAPAVTKTATISEVAIAQVLIPASTWTTSSTVTAGMITDVRPKAFQPYLGAASTSNIPSALVTNAGQLMWDIPAGFMRVSNGTTLTQLAASPLVCTSSTRPTGVGLFTGQQIYETDTLQCKSYNGTAWVTTAFGSFICTSTTRPTGAALYNGLQIWETNTYRLLTYSTATTTWTQPWNMPWGKIAEVQSTSASALSVVGAGAASDLTGMSVTFTAVGNRRLRITGKSLVNSTVGTDYACLKIRDSAATVYDLGQVVAASNGVTISVSSVISPATGSVTFKLSGNVTTGTGTCVWRGDATFPILLLVEDIGPNGNPA